MEGTWQKTETLAAIPRCLRLANARKEDHSKMPHCCLSRRHCVTFMAHPARKREMLFGYLFTAFTKVRKLEKNSANAWRDLRLAQLAQTLIRSQWPVLAIRDLCDATACGLHVSALPRSVKGEPQIRQNRGSLPAPLEHHAGRGGDAREPATRHTVLDSPLATHLHFLDVKTSPEKVSYNIAIGGEDPKSAAITFTVTYDIKPSEDKDKPGCNVTRTVNNYHQTKYLLLPGISIIRKALLAENINIEKLVAPTTTTTT
eukprot:g11760.t1